MENASVSQLPLRIGEKADFARVVQSLKGAGFEAATICRALKVSEMAAIEGLKPDEIDLQEAPEPLALFIRLFLLMDLLPRAEVESLLARETLDSFLALDLLRIGDYGADSYYTPVFLYPLADLFIVSDRHSNPDRSAYTPPPDIVFPAIGVDTRRFLRVISHSATENGLELCAGAGAAALILSRQATIVVASDITVRAAHFARFNAMLNDCRNVEAVCGDLYGAVEGQTFDRIVAHPPYVPRPQAAIIWRDGGDTGESLFRRIIEGLPQSLRRGGTAYVLTMGLDTRQGLLEERARRWLGDAESEFDILLAHSYEKSMHEILGVLAQRNKNLEEEDLAKIKQAFEREEMLQAVYGALALHRRTDVNAAPWTARVRLSEETEGADFEWAFKWHQQRLRPNFVEELAQAMPRLSPHLQLKVTHVMHEGELVPAEFMLESAKPFHFVTRFDSEVVPLILQFNGQTSLTEIYETARAESAMPDTFTLQDFTKLVAMLIDKGYLILDEF
jgi:methylase of polypeptide subunit release factors